MEELLDKVDQLPVRRFQKGDVVEGEVVSVNEWGALVDVGAKAEGIIPQSELKERELTAGEYVLVYVLTPEDHRGQLLLSLERAKSVRSWLELREAFGEGKTLEATVSGSNKGGLIMEFNGLTGFLPFSHTDSVGDTSLDQEALKSLLKEMEGEVLKVRVIELDENKNRIILSEKEALIGEDLEERREQISGLREGEVVSGKVSAIMPYGLMLKSDGIEGLIPREEISWEDKNTDELLSGYEVGQKLRAQVIEVDQDLGKVQLSLKNITRDPWKDFAKQYDEGDVVEAVVTRMTSYGIFVRIEEGVEGMVTLSSVPEDEQLSVGQKILVKIGSIDANNRQLDLTYQQQKE